MLCDSLRLYLILGEFKTGHKTAILRDRHRHFKTGMFKKLQCVHVFLSRIFAARSRLFDRFFKKLIWQFCLSILEWFSPEFSWRSDIWVRRGAPHTKTVVFHQILIIYWWIKNNLSCIVRYDLPVFQHTISFDYLLRECKLYLFHLGFHWFFRKQYKLEAIL